MNVQDAIEGFLIDLRAKRRTPTTLRHYEHKLRIWSRWLATEQDVANIEQITIAHLRAFLVYMEQVPATRHHPGKVEREGDPKVTDRTVYGYAQVIKTFCGWLVREELLDRDPSLRLAKPKVGKKVIASFTKDHLQAMFSACNLSDHLGFRDYTLMLTLIDTGMRNSEICGLELDGIRVDHVLVRGKGDKEREIGITPTTAKYLWKYLKVHRRSAQPDETHVFLGRRGTPMTPSGIDQALYRIRDAIGLYEVRLSAHTFRHSFSRMWLEHGGELYSLSRLLGHSSVQVTEVYLREFQSRQARVHHNEFSPLADFQPPRGKRRQHHPSTHRDPRRDDTPDTSADVG
jgi:site-specific recombinase XerD